MAPDLVQVRPTSRRPSLVVSLAQGDAQRRGHQLLDTTPDQRDLPSRDPRRPRGPVRAARAAGGDAAREPAGCHDADAALDRHRPRSSSRRTARSRSSTASRGRRRSATSARRRRSSAARCPTRRPPGPTEPAGATGAADHIRVDWQAEPRARPRRLPDLPRRLRPRRSCTCPGIRAKTRRARSIRRARAASLRHDPRRRCAGRRRRGDARGRRRASGSRISAVPEGSPLCYGYWVRAYDQAGRTSTPATRLPAARDEYVCMRLRREDAAARAGRHRPAGAQQRRARRVDRLAGPGPAGVPRLPLGRASRSAGVPRLRLHRRHGQPDAVDGGGPVVRRHASRAGSARRPRLLPRHDRGAAGRSTGIACRRSTGSATRARGRPPPASRRAARSRTRSELPVEPVDRSPRARRRPPAAASRCTGTRRSTRPRSRGSSSSAALAAGRTGRCPAIVPDNAFTDPTARRGVAISTASSRSTATAGCRRPSPAGAAPLLTADRRPPMAILDEFDPQTQRLVLRELGRGRRLHLGPLPADVSRRQPDQRSDRGAARRGLLPDLQVVRGRRELRRHAACSPSLCTSTAGSWASARPRPSTPGRLRHSAARSRGPARGDQHHAGAPVQRARHPELPRRRQGRRAQRRHRGVRADQERARQRRLLHALALERDLRRRRPHGHPVQGRRHHARRARRSCGSGIRTVPSTTSRRTTPATSIAIAITGPRRGSTTRNRVARSRAARRTPGRWAAVVLRHPDLARAPQGPSSDQRRVHPHEPPPCSSSAARVPRSPRSATTRAGGSIRATGRTDGSTRSRPRAAAASTVSRAGRGSPGLVVRPRMAICTSCSGRRALPR